MIALRSIRQRRTTAASQAKHKAFLREHARQERRIELEVSRWRKPIIDQILGTLEDYPNPNPVAELLWRPSNTERESFRRLLTRGLNRLQISGASLERQFIEAATGEKLSKRRQSAGLPSLRFRTELQIAPASPEVDPNDILIEFSPQMRAAVEIWTSQREVGIWNAVSAGLKTELSRSIREALNEGLSIRDMIPVIRERLEGYNRQQARTVARTEATGAMNHGADVEMIDAEVPYHEWIRTIDNRTRGYDPKKKSKFDHYRAAQVVEISEPFVVSGQKLRYPGDTSLGASAGNVINCRCSAAANFDGPKSGGRKPPPPKPPQPPPVAQPPEQPSPGPTAAPAPPAPVPALPPQPVRKTLTERISDAQNREDVREMRRKLGEVHAEFAPQKRAAQSAIESADSRLEELNREAKKLLRLSKAGTVERSELVRMAEDFQSRYDAVVVTRSKAVRELAAIQADARTRTAKLLGNTGSDPFATTLRTQPAKTINSSGRRVTISPPNSSYKAKLKEASDFISRIWKRTTDAIEAEASQLPFGSRAFCRKNGVYLSGSNGTETFVHELGHVIENAHSDVSALLREYLEMRIKRSGTRDVRLMDVFPGVRYGPNELGNADDFTRLFGKSAYYVGKRYPDGSSELLSMCLEMLFEDAAEFAVADPELFSFLVTLMEGTL